jgi:hypothetical protein
VIPVTLRTGDSTGLTNIAANIAIEQDVYRNESEMAREKLTPPRVKRVSE